MPPLCKPPSSRGGILIRRAFQLNLKVKPLGVLASNSRFSCQRFANNHSTPNVNSTITGCYSQVPLKATELNTLYLANPVPPRGNGKVQYEFSRTPKIVRKLLKIGGVRECLKNFLSDNLCLPQGPLYFSKHTFKFRKETHLGSKASFP